MQYPILGPLVALVLWSLIIWIWMYARMIPVIINNKLVYNPYKPKDEFISKFPPETRWPADNYNHLMEQPTIFYAIVLTLAVVGDKDEANVLIAWAYVALRLVHSLVQILWNEPTTRFVVFVASTFAVMALAVRTSFIVFSEGLLL